MRYFVLLMALVLSSCSHDIRVNDGWVIYDLRPLDGGCIMYYGEDGRFSIFNSDILPRLKRVGFLDTNARNPDITIAGITLAIQFGNALPKYITGCKNITVVDRSARRAHPRAIA